MGLFAPGRMRCRYGGRLFPKKGSDITFFYPEHPADLLVSGLIIEVHGLGKFTFPIRRERYSPKWILNLTLRESLVANGIASYSFYDADKILNTTYGNIIRSSVTGLNVFANWNASANTRIFLNGGLNYSDFSSKVLEQSNSGLSYNAMLGFQQTLPAGFQLSANVIAMGRNYSLQGWGRRC